MADQGGLQMLGQAGEWLVFSDQQNSYHPELFLWNAAKTS